MNVETLDCDVCGAKIADFENDLFHYSGILYGKQSTHIHLCAKCESELTPPFFDFDAALEKKRSREVCALEDTLEELVCLYLKTLYKMKNLSY